MSWVASVRVLGAKATAGRLRRMGDRFGDARPVFDRIARMLMEDERKRFARQPWVPLDADTIRQKAKAGHSPQIMRATGRLQDALTVWGAPGQKLDVDPHELVFGLDGQGVAYYGTFHQKGESNPKREVVQATARTRRRVREALRDFLLGR